MQVVEEEFEPGFGAYIGFGIISLISVFILQLLCISIVDSLPRIYGWERGENVDAPRWLCIVIAFGLPILVPWAAASMVVRHRRLRWYFLACQIGRAHV